MNVMKLSESEVNKMPEYINNDEKLHRSFIRAVKVLANGGFSSAEIAALFRIPETNIRSLSEDA